jgi:valyl-tRNA synthetase
VEKKYDHKIKEPEIQKKWEDSGVFVGKIDPNKKPFTIVLPPPNASGKMHVGNVLMIALEDILIRWKKMSGYSTLWLPGTDHAGFETQVVFERYLILTEIPCLKKFGILLRRIRKLFKIK